MAGDWGKVELETPDKPEVYQLARLLKIHPDEAFGACVRFWFWCNKVSENGTLLGTQPVDIDARFRRPGFAQALVDVGWLRSDAENCHVPSYDRHNSKNAKTRALSGERQKKHRSEKEKP